MGANKYLYSVSRTRALENYLLDKNVVERMIDAKTPEDVLKVLAETAYNESVNGIGHYTEYEKVLLKEQKYIYAFLRELCPDPMVIDIFAMKYDIHNLKVLFKAHYLNESKDELLNDNGTIPIKILKAAIEESIFTDLSQEFRAVIQKIVEVNGGKVSPKSIDEILDSFYYDEASKNIRKCKSNILTKYFEAQIDFINIKTFARIKGIGLERDHFKNAFIKNGKLELGIYLNHFEEGLEAFIEALQYSDYREVVRDGLERFIVTNRLTRYEKLADDYVFEIAKQSKYIAFGVEPIIGFLLAKENEIKIIRMLMVGKINSIPNEVIRERLRDVYV